MSINAAEHLADALNVSVRPLTMGGSGALMRTREDLKATNGRAASFTRAVLAKRLPEALRSGAFQSLPTPEALAREPLFIAQLVPESERSGREWKGIALGELLVATADRSTEAVRRGLAALERSMSASHPLRDSDVSEVRDMLNVLHRFLQDEEVLPAEPLSLTLQRWANEYVEQHRKIFGR